MFGNSNNQQNVSNSTVTPQEPTNQSSSFGPDPTPSSQQVDSTTSSPASVFPPTTDSADPFGTSQSSPATESDTETSSASPATTTPAPADDSLLDIKQQALNHLSPLVEHLEQAPEEKFKTTMMMIQASDDKSLIPAAFSAAKAITDDKARAQALLDIINEINYFTQQQ